MTIEQNKFKDNLMFFMHETDNDIFEAISKMSDKKPTNLTTFEKNEVITELLILSNLVVRR